MHLAFSSNGFTRYTLDEAIREIAERVESAGMRICNLNAFPTCYLGDTYHASWIHDGEAERRVEYTRHCLDLAKAWGVPHLSTLPGGPLDDGMDREAALARFRGGLESLYPDCRRAGAKILIEPEPGLLIERSEEFLAFAADLDPECVGLNFDVGHFFCVGEDPAELVPRLAEWTGHYHLEDIHENRFHYHLTPGKGAIDLAGVMRAIHDTGYGGFVTVEVYTRSDRPAEAVRESIQYLQGLHVGT
jgi:sugar phosphate isomerase/epimerase